MDAVYVALILCASLAVSCIVISIPLYLGKIKRNYYYGVRTLKTLSSDAIWFSANRDSGLYIIFAGIIVLFTACGLFLLRSTLPELVLLVIIIFVSIASFIGAVVKIFMNLSKY